jgi:DNA repair protein RadD
MKPRYYQQESHDAAWDYLRYSPGSPVIVLPTGAGKSLVIAMLVEQAREYDARVIVLQHRKELIEQNAEKIQTLLPDIRIGINSAGLKQRDYDHDVICAGIQSVYRAAEKFGRRELIIIDEVHLVGDNDSSMYGQFLHGITELNQKARLVGLTATPFRTGEGVVCGPDKLFQEICYESQTGRLIEEGYLCPVTNKPADATVDTSGIKVRGGEFIAGDAERAFDTDRHVQEACLETVEKCQGRHSILVFAAGVTHAEHVTEELAHLTQEKVGLITGDTFPMERQQLLADFKKGDLRWLINCNVLTTGFDAPCIDAIAVLRATMSPGLFAQIVGRGLRKHESKENCLILDFGENIKRHGSLDDPNYGRDELSEGEGDGEGQTKQCPNCENDVAVNFKTCPECGFEFPCDVKPRHETEADEHSSVIGEAEPECWTVTSVNWTRHTKRNAPDAPPTLRLDYYCQPLNENLGNLTETRIQEWVCIEHVGFAATKAKAWWDAHSNEPMPTSVSDAIWMLDRHMGRMPARLTTIQEGKWRRIRAVDFDDERPVPEEYVEAVTQVDAFGMDDLPF